MRFIHGLSIGVGFAVLGACAASYQGADIPNGGFGGGGFISGAGGGSSAGGGAAAADGGVGCSHSSQCPTGYTCDLGTCVAPETESDRSLGDAPPVATPRYVFALNPTASSVARIDPTSLQIEALAVGPGPVALAALPDEDAAVVLSVGDGSLSIIDASTSPSKVIRVPLKRQYARLTVSADGRYVVAWPSPTVAPSSGAEGIFALVDLQKARAQAGGAVQERAGGYRITDVLFRIDGRAATALYVFAKSTVSTFDLVSSAPLPTRLALPASMAADVTSREVVASVDGHVVMLRSTVSPELASFDGAQLHAVPLPEIATDLDLLPDGKAAVAALRSAGSVAYIEVPADLADPAGIDTFPLDGGVVGQVALPPAVPDAGMFALVYSTVSDAEAFARIDLPGGTVTRYPLEKRVEEISLSPDGRSALILHAATPNTTATDPYEAAVDRDQGFSVFDVRSGFWQLQRTGSTRPTRYAWSPAGGYVGVALRDDGLKKYQLMAVNLGTLVTTTLPLASTPLFMGTVPPAPGVTPHRVFVSQDHPAGRISVIQLDSGQVRTATGFTLNGEIE
ncbi:MAG: YncE family protein [Myxococcota bacterium]